MKKLFLFLGCSIFTLISCQNTNFKDLGTESYKDEKKFKNYSSELKNNYKEMQDYLIQETLKEIDIPKTIVYIEKPVYYPVEGQSDRPELKGKDAVKKSTQDSLQEPSRFTNGTMYYDFDDDFTYEVYCQPYRVTDLILEPGEQVIEMPFLSEEKVWEVGAGVSRSNGIDTQHFFLKPAYSGLVTSFIVITDRRVYHILLKSFKDCYMTQVRWLYPNKMPFNIKTQAMQESVNKLTESTVSVDPKYLSFDYKMRYSAFKKPYWLPLRVYDDGKRTYIVMNETVLHMATPVLFNKRNEQINYSVDKNIIVLYELIEKVTLRIGKEKVVITKSKYKEEKNPKLPPSIEEIKLENKNAMLHSSDMYYAKKIQAQILDNNNDEISDSKE